jgi:hypothetical protein
MYILIPTRRAARSGRSVEATREVKEKKITSGTTRYLPTNKVKKRHTAAISPHHSAAITQSLRSNGGEV